VAAAQVIVYAGAVMVLYVFVVAYIGGGETARARAPGHRPALGLDPLFAGALFVELCIAVLGTGLQRSAREPARAYSRGFGTPARSGTLFLTEVPARVRGRLAAAADRRRSARSSSPGRRTGLEDRARDLRRRPHAPVQGHARRRERGTHARGRRAAAPMSIEWYLVVSALMFCIGAGGILVAPQPAGDPALPRADAQRGQPRARRLRAPARQPATARSSR
jgi:hypothetical protein